MIFPTIVFCLYVTLGSSLDYDDVHEVTELSILSNRLIEDESLSILHVSVLSTPEQRKKQGKNDDIVLDFQSRIEEYENSVRPESYDKFELRQLPLLPAVEASEKGPVLVVNNPFFDRNHTLNDIRTQERCWGAGCALPPVTEHNFTVNGLQYLTGLLSTLAKRYGEGLNRKVQLVPLLLTRRIHTMHNTMMTQVYSLNTGVALVAPEKGGVKPLAALVLKLKEKSDNHLVYDPFESSPDYYEYIDPVYTPGEILIPNETGITFAHS